MKKEVDGIPPMANEINLSANEGMKEEGAPSFLGPISRYLQILLVGYLTPMVGREKGLRARLCKGTPPPKEMSRGEWRGNCSFKDSKGTACHSVP